nr:hypothetical protein BaRGS_034725 [Batillaria attramentaria]
MLYDTVTVDLHLGNCDGGGQWHVSRIRNLSFHLAPSEDVAHALLLQERVAKTGVDGQQLTEAKSINLSLHYLESVIIALQGDLGQTPQRASSANKRPKVLYFQQEGGSEQHEDESSSKLTDEDKIACAHVVQEYLAGRITDPVTAEERGRQGTAQTESRANSSRSPARTEGYKSPYERKREKEIRQLTNKLESMKKTQEAREQQLHQMRMNTALGELTNMESIIRNKIQVTREQIADQHAYLLHLRHTEANNEIKQREKMVEDQLLKREARFQKKLDEVLHRKAEIEAQAAGLEGEGQVKSGEKRTLEDQYSQYKKRNGTLNTRQVFDMLKSEEKKQTKAMQDTQRESTYMGRIQAERDRISKIRRAREAAEAIQRAWRRYSQYSS